MKTIILAAAAALALGGGGALAADGGEASYGASPFTIWQQEGTAGKALTPLAQLAVPASGNTAVAQSTASQDDAAQHHDTMNVFVTQGRHVGGFHDPVQGANS